MTKPTDFDWKKAYELMQWPVAIAIALVIALLAVR